MHDYYCHGRYEHKPWETRCRRVVNTVTSSQMEFAFRLYTKRDVKCIITIRGIALDDDAAIRLNGNFPDSSRSTFPCPLFTCP